MSKHYVVVTGIIVKDGNYLIVKRSEKEKAFPGKWAVPGGKLTIEDFINTPKTTSEHWYFVLPKVLKREILEEVGLEVYEPRYLLDLVYMHPNGNPTLILSFFCHWKNGEVKLSEELTEYKWVNIEEAEQYDLVEGLLEEIQEVDSVLKRA